eukprot:gnl/TRDRNA2_/TRDRNA2_164802_c1_seq2.p1 gnl/TRDRNA2_/TRDRNA2_164802_c1~~gnl/TRDRNA2_/TRDRNA2_164802_c1_seq2.p1  ORF type:complete len:300 (+),score=50.24 gnl/TRDRNA2_/TRDRNA2_164802_c1_seq2:73-972(+)
MSAAIYAADVYDMGVQVPLPMTLPPVDSETGLPPLPPVASLQFVLLVITALGGPYVFCCITYIYHFTCRKRRPLLRDHASDGPQDKHRPQDWIRAISRPEGISAVVGYMMIILVTGPILGIVDMVPTAVKDLTPVLKPLVVAAYFLVFDLSMWMIHYCQHNIPKLYYYTHSVHHTIHSPTIILALTGYLPDTCLLIIAPLHFTLCVVPKGNFFSIFVFAALSLWHLHMIHSEFEHGWDQMFRRLGLVNSMDHHVHHLRPKRNLAHFFVFYDKMFGTYVDPMSLHQIKEGLRLREDDKKQ